ncbi:unnamed protein product [Lymnaea stagnalis]|uniref:Proline-rich transmembrane protein 1 n=1 Tax=Lymnaea stagnalis TaxID=6523 RepID=A0AAV2HVN6_LYMST
MEKSGEVPPAYTDLPPGEQQQYAPPPGYTQQPGYPGYYGPPQPGYGYPQQGFEHPPQQGYGPPPNYMGVAPPGQYPQQQFQYTGTNNIVVTQQPGSYPIVGGPAPPDHMCAAIFVTLCCFWPTGIVAIMRASDARSALARGDIPAATAHARSAKSMVTISVVIGIIAFVLVAIIIGVYVGLAMRAINDQNY